MWLMMQAEAADDYVIATAHHSVRDFLDAAFWSSRSRWQEYVEIDPRYYRPRNDLLQGDASKRERS